MKWQPLWVEQFTVILVITTFPYSNNKNIIFNDIIFIPNRLSYSCIRSVLYLYHLNCLKPFPYQNHNQRSTEILLSGTCHCHLRYLITLPYPNHYNRFNDRLICTTILLDCRDSMSGSYNFHPSYHITYSYPSHNNRLHERIMCTLVLSVLTSSLLWR